MKHKLTQQDVDKMKAEIEHRKVEVRPELLEHVKEARAHGDLSENFEYHAAKKEKNRKTHDGAGSQKKIIEKFQAILDNNLFDTLGIVETECCGVPVEKILSVKQKYIYKIKLIEEMIQYRNRLDKNGNNPECSGEEEE